MNRLLTKCLWNFQLVSDQLFLQFASRKRNTDTVDIIDCRLLYIKCKQIDCTMTNFMFNIKIPFKVFIKLSTRFWMISLSINFKKKYRHKIHILLICDWISHAYQITFKTHIRLIVTNLLHLCLLILCILRFISLGLLNTKETFVRVKWYWYISTRTYALINDVKNILIFHESYDEQNNFQSNRYICFHVD